MPVLAYMGQSGAFLRLTRRGSLTTSLLAVEYMNIDLMDTVKRNLLADLAWILHPKVYGALLFSLMYTLSITVTKQA